MSKIVLPDGHVFDYLDPKPADISILRIAKSLSKLCRFVGTIDYFYSVAEHSVLMAYQLMEETKDPVIAQCALLHDASESLMSDLASPLKALLPKYQEMEDNLWKKAIAPHFNLPLEMPKEVKIADQRILLREMELFLPKAERPWNIPADIKPYGMDIQPWNHDLAYESFIMHFTELAAERRKQGV